MSSFSGPIGARGERGLSGVISRACLRDQKAANTQSGTFTSGSWQTRVLNTELFDPDGIVTLSSNQFTLGAGTYRIDARSPAFKCLRHQAKIRNITDSVDEIIGSSCYSNSAVDANVDSIVRGLITVVGTKTFELQHQCQSTATNQGLGVEANMGVTEVYAEVYIEKIL